MQHSQQGHYQNDIFHEHRAAQRRPTSHEHRGNHIGDERVGETRAGICGVLRWKIVTMHKTGDDLQVKGKVTKVVRESSEYFAPTLEHDTVEDPPEQNYEETGEDDAADFLPTGPATGLSKLVHACADVSKHLTTNLSGDQDGQSEGEDAGSH